MTARAELNKLLEKLEDKRAELDKAAAEFLQTRKAKAAGEDAATAVLITVTTHMALMQGVRTAMTVLDGASAEEAVAQMAAESKQRFDNHRRGSAFGL